MTAELNELANDPNYIVEIAIGEPFPELIPQNPNSGIRFCGIYSNEPKRYILKKCHFSQDDLRIIDADSGLVILVSHHPGKNPYESLDPLDLSNVEQQYQVNGGEWESVCDVTSQHESIRHFKIRPKSISRHGRQYIKTMDDELIMTVGKKSKLKTKSMRPHFEVKDADGGIVCTVVADMMERTFTMKNDHGDVIAQVAKTTSAMIKTAVFGSGSESTIDIAPGVDCSVILAIVFGVRQVGAHYLKDGINSYVVDPIKDSMVGAGIDMLKESITGGGIDAVVDSITGAMGGSDDEAEDVDPGEEDDSGTEEEEVYEEEVEEEEDAGEVDEEEEEVEDVEEEETEE